MTSDGLLTRLVTPRGSPRDRWQGLLDRLDRLLNTRCLDETGRAGGALAAYGLPATWLPEVAGPRWQQELADAIRRALRRWEPHLLDVEVLPPEEKEADPLVYRLTAACAWPGGIRESFEAWVVCRDGEAFRVVQRKGGKE
jgi:predicted component of type VI protein secretion system